MSDRELCQVCGEKDCQGNPVCGLKYIISSPAQGHGGFHPNTVEIAKSALETIQALTKRTHTNDTYFLKVAVEKVNLEEERDSLRQSLDEAQRALREIAELDAAKDSKEGW